MPVLKIENAIAIPKPPEFQTLYISGGKRTSSIK